MQAIGGVPFGESSHRVGGHRSRRRDVRQLTPVRPREAQRAIRDADDPVSVLVNGTVVTAAEEDEVRERGGATLGPVPDVMPLSDTRRAAREATRLVPMVKSAPQRGRDRPGPRANLDRSPVRIVAHHHPARVARQTP
jgi:hypothetical protein